MLVLELRMVSNIAIYGIFFQLNYIITLSNGTKPMAQWQKQLN